MKKYLFVILFSVLGCDNKQPNVELIQDMMDQPSFKAQDYDPNNPTGATMRLPPEGTVPRGFKPHQFKANEGELAGKKLVNPYAKITDVQTMAQIQAKGRERYQTFCAVCHGDQGKGDGPVAEKMPVKPRSLLTEQARKYADGQLYHIIAVGIGVMGPYAGQVGTPENRWALVEYIRSLQQLNKETK